MDNNKNNRYFVALYFEAVDYEFGNETDEWSNFHMLYAKTAAEAVTEAITHYVTESPESACYLVEVKVKRDF